MLNINKLKGKIVENGFSMENVADKIGIDKSTFYRKMSYNGDKFTIKEANNLVDLLKIEPEEAAAIFFAQTVAEMPQSKKEE